MVLRAFFLFSFFFLLIGSGESWAARSAADLAKAQNEVLNERVVSLLRTLDQEESRHFLVMYANYNIYSLVKAVREDVGQAVAGCAENNRDLADDLRDRFAKWDASVGGTMETAYAGIQNLALAQTYISQSELQLIFKLLEEVRGVNSSRFEKIPVTTPEACQFMLSKMDETQVSMNSLLKATLVSYPDLLQKTQE